MLLLQVTSREKGIPIDTLGFEVHVLGSKARELTAPSDGVYVKVNIAHFLEQCTLMPRTMKLDCLSSIPSSYQIGLDPEG